VAKIDAVVEATGAAWYAAVRAADGAGWLRCIGQQQTARMASSAVFRLKEIVSAAVLLFMQCYDERWCGGRGDRGCVVCCCAGSRWCWLDCAALGSSEWR
jgi:hypothetical protein